MPHERREIFEVSPVAIRLLRRTIDGEATVEVNAMRSSVRSRADRACQSGGGANADRPGGFARGAIEGECGASREKTPFQGLQNLGIGITGLLYSGFDCHLFDSR